MKNPLHSRRSIAAGAAAFGGVAVFALMNALGSGPPVLSFTPAAAIGAAADDTATTAPMGGEGYR